MDQAHDLDKILDCVLGVLTPLEVRGVEEHIDACATCRLHHAELLDALGGLTLTLAPASPPSALRGRLDASLDHLERFSGFAPRLAEVLGLEVNDARRALHVFERPREMPATALDGMRAVPIAPGPSRDATTAMLVLFEPGARLPVHVHAEEEHVLVFQGAFVSDPGPLVSAGEEHTSPAGSSHAIRVLEEEPCLCAIIKTKRPLSPG